MQERSIPPVIFDMIEVGPLMVNCYLIGCQETGVGAIIDPGDESERILEMATRHRIKVEQIIITHGHSDHIAAVDEIKSATDADIYIHKDDAGMLTDPAKNLSLYFSEPVAVPSADGFLEEGRPHNVGKVEFKIFHVPGHSAGSVCLYNDGIAIVGDTVFNGSIGRTDFPGGSFDRLIQNIKSKLFTLPGNTILYPGHGPQTTVEQEKRINPFLRD
jgi:glyoxylase-like metal-dependent hydrolase (beta-lactamase superfamily II)